MIASWADAASRISGRHCLTKSLPTAPSGPPPPLPSLPSALLRGSSTVIDGGGGGRGSAGDFALRKQWPRLGLPADLGALALLAVIAWSIAGFLLRDDLFVYGDHPGHYWIMWYTLNVAWGLHHRLIDWIPYWYAGYPELQFTPPGFVLFGWLLNLITLGKLTTMLIYEIVAFVGFVLPGLTFYYAVRHWGFGWRAAFLAGLFGLVFPAFFDGSTALFIGMIGSRLAWALDALILAWGADWLEGRAMRSGWLLALALAVALLMHPYHEIGMMLALAIYALVRRLPILASGIRLAIVVLIASALDAFWLAPLLAYSSNEMIPLIRGTLDQSWHLIVDPQLVPYVILAIPALVRAVREQDPRRRALLIVLVALPVGLSFGMLGLHVILIDLLRIYQLDPIRLIGEIYFPLLLLAAIGGAELARWGAEFFRSNGMRAQVLSTVLTLSIALLLFVPTWQSSAYFHPQANEEPRFLSQAIAGYRLNELWETLRATPGRVLFTSFSTRLAGHGGEPFPTTLAALTPLFSNRPLIGGTYSHWSPVAALVWVGKVNPSALWGLAEEQDDRALFGVPLEALADRQFAEYCRALNITAIVAGANDYQTRTFLDRSPYLQSKYNNGSFFVYEVKEPGAWFEAQRADVELLANADDQLSVRIHSAEAGATLGIKIHAYPLWRAETDDHRSLPITRDEWGLMQLALPAGKDYVVTVRYEPGAVEALGNLISLAGGLAFLIGGIAILGKRISSRLL